MWHNRTQTSLLCVTYKFTKGVVCMTSVTINIRVSPEEHLLLSTIATQKCLKLSVYIRQAALLAARASTDVPQLVTPITAKPALQPKPTPPTPEPAPTPVVEPQPKVDLTPEQRAAIATAWGFSDE